MSGLNFEELEILENPIETYFEKSLKFFKEMPEQERYTKYRSEYIKIFSDSELLIVYQNEVAAKIAGYEITDYNYWRQKWKKRHQYWYPKDYTLCKDPLRKWLVNVLTANQCLFLTHSTKDYESPSSYQLYWKKVVKFFKSSTIGSESYWAMEFYCGKEGNFRPHLHMWVKPTDNRKFRQHSQRTFGIEPACKIINYNDIHHGIDYVKTPQSDDKKSNKLEDEVFRKTIGMETINYKV